MTSDVVEERLQSEHPIIQEVPVKVITEPFLGRQGKTKMREYLLQLQENTKILGGSNKDGSQNRGGFAHIE